MTIRNSVFNTSEERALLAHLAAIDIASSLIELVKNPDLLKIMGKNAVEANKLSEEERKIRDDALASIAESNHLLNQKNELLSDLEKRDTEIQHLHIKNMKDIEARKSDFELEIADKKNKLDAYQDELQVKENNLKDLSVTLENRKLSLDQREAAIDEKDAIIKQREAAIEHVGRLLSQ